MSEHKVEVCMIDAVEAHPNADRLDIVTVKGWNCVVQKGAFKVHDVCVYIPIDSVLSPATEARLFPADSKITLNKGRIKTVRIRGCISQGMCVPLLELAPAGTKVGTCLASSLGITKYDPPKKCRPTLPGKKGQRLKVYENPHFSKYTDLQHLKNYPNVFAEGEAVVVTEKIHGTNFRAGWVPFVPHTLWEKIKDWFGTNPLWQFVYGSRNLQLQTQEAQKKSNYYATDVYFEAVLRDGLMAKIPKGYVVYGEIYGPSIQKGYHYGLKDDERALVLFDVQHVDSGYLNYLDARDFLDAWGLPSVPLVYHGPFTQARIDKFTCGDSLLAPSQKVREGVVVRPVVESSGACGRRVLKSINADYLLGKYADEDVAHDQIENAP